MVALTSLVAEASSGAGALPMVRLSRYTTGDARRSHL